MGNTYVAGQSGQGTSGIDYVVVRYSPIGVELWATPIDGVSTGTDVPRAIAFDEGSGAVYVTGESQAGPVQVQGNRDFLTVKINGTTGLPVWEDVTTMWWAATRKTIGRPTWRSIKMVMYS